MSAHRRWAVSEPHLLGASELARRQGLFDRAADLVVTGAGRAQAVAGENAARVSIYDE